MKATLTGSDKLQAPVLSAWTGDWWLVTGDRWLVTCDRWLVTSDRWQVSGDWWQVTGDWWQVTGDLLHDPSWWLLPLRQLASSVMPGPTSPLPSNITSSDFSINSVVNSIIVLYRIIIIVLLGSSPNVNNVFIISNIASVQHTNYI